MLRRHYTIHLLYNILFVFGIIPTIKIEYDFALSVSLSVKALLFTVLPYIKGVVFIFCYFIPLVVASAFSNHLLIRSLYFVLRTLLIVYNFTKFKIQFCINIYAVLLAHNICFSFIANKTIVFIKVINFCNIYSSV